MYAVISDIHGNLEALDAVLDAIGQLDAKRIICLGDLVCYGPDSPECVRRSADWDIVVAGDWDLAMISHNPTQWPQSINEHIDWVRSQFLAAPDSEILLDILQSYHREWSENGRTFAHGTPNDSREWVFPEDINTPIKLNRIAKTFVRECICGHSHIQGLFKQNDQSEWEFALPIIGKKYKLHQHQKTIVTVGSVGQPRDEDPRASFITVDGNEIIFHRVVYNVGITVEKIRSIPQIDNMHGERLLFGR